MDSIVFFETNIFILYLLDKDYINEVVYLSARDKINEIAKWFGFSVLPQQLKLRINVVDLNYIKIYIKIYNLNIPINSIAFTISGNKIYILSYTYLSKVMSETEYIKLIIHECTHTLQMYFSKITPEKYVWLYESIACYISNQYSDYVPNKSITWDIFKNDFYNVKDCYGLAYKYGLMLFKHYSKQKILNLIKYPEENLEIFKNVYNMLYL